MVLDDNLAAREYNSLRQEILAWLKHRVTMSFTIATLTAGLYVFAVQTDNPHAGAVALLIPQVFVAWTYAFLRRNSQLLVRLACYLAVFHEMPLGGGWELFSRYPFRQRAMQRSYRAFGWIPISLFTTHGLLLCILLSSASLLFVTQPFIPWGLIGIALPLGIIAHHVFCERPARDYQQTFLRRWQKLKRQLDEGQSTEAVVHKILGINDGRETMSEFTQVLSDFFDAINEEMKAQKESSKIITGQKLQDESLRLSAALKNATEEDMEHLRALEELLAERPSE